MEMKWHPIEGGDMKGVPRDEDVIFTVLDEQTGEVYTAIGEVGDFFLEECGQVFVGVTSYPVDTESLKAWMKLPQPFKLKDCNGCPLNPVCTDKFGDIGSECMLFKVTKIKPEDCPLKKEV